MKVMIAKTSLAACEAGFYNNAHGARVALAGALASAKAGTVMHVPGPLETRVPRLMTITVTGETTIDALVRLSPKGGHLGCLNFASAKNPGGGFLAGAQAQEESLARASGLYPCQTSVPEFYEANRAHRSPIYRDAALFSPHVPFFRDDDGGWLDAAVLASVITCPAPNASALRLGAKEEHVEAARYLLALLARAARALRYRVAPRSSGKRSCCSGHRWRHAKYHRNSRSRPRFPIPVLEIKTRERGLAHHGSHCSPIPSSKRRAQAGSRTGAARRAARAKQASWTPPSTPLSARHGLLDRSHAPRLPSGCSVGASCSFDPSRRFMGCESQRAWSPTFRSDRVLADLGTELHQKSGL